LRGASFDLLEGTLYVSIISRNVPAEGGGEIHGDMHPRPASRLAILLDTTHVTLMNRMTTIVPMVNDFLDAKPQKQ